MKNLVIVESPTKARTIGRFLSKDYEIKASMGHIMDLPKSKLGVDVDHGFLPAYELVLEKKMVIADLKESGKKADSIILATDPDREGEAIASHIKDMLSSSVRQAQDDAEPAEAPNSKSEILNSKFKRIVFHEITKEAIEEALKNPRDIDQDLVDAQTARRVLDRLVGYKLSPVLWQKVRRGLSAGRVQSVALRLIVEREREIEKFKKEKYWTISAIYLKDKEIEFELIEINGGKMETQETSDLYDGQYRVTKSILGSEEKAKEVARDLNKKNFAVSDVSKKETRRSPYPPFTTSTLQQEASRRLGFWVKRTMSLAQKLYEEGFITYHRTDSVAIAQSATFALRDYVKKEFGEKYVPDQPRFYKTKQKLAQEAHEAIRPTGLNNLPAGKAGQPSAINNQLGRDYEKLYELIWRRAVASQMSDAIIEQTNVLVDSTDKKYRFKANGSVLLFDGFLKVTPQALNDTLLPDFKVNEEIKFREILEKEHETTPPPRYNDASLVATLEEKGIGRPSTYATIISTIESRRYTERDPPAGGGKFVPTPVGVAVNDFLVKNFSSIDDVPFTAQMEDELDAVANEKKEWVPVIQKFYGELKQKLEDVKDAQRVKIEVEKTDEICPKCGSKLVIRIGKFGKFLSCSTFPKCDFTKPYLEEIGVPCPKCGGQIILRRTRKGRKFYGCSNYPNCDFASWTKPTSHV